MEHPRQNRGYRYILVFQDLFSKKIALEAISHKSGPETALALEKAIKRVCKRNKELKILGTDKGKEYVNLSVQNLLKKYNFEHRVFMHNQKQSTCEKLNKDLQQIIYRNLSYNNSVQWYTLLKALELRHNNTKHHSTLYKPNEINSSNSEIVFQNLYRKIIRQGKRKPHRYQLGNYVRIPVKLNSFAKGYRPQFSREVYKVVHIVPSWPVFTYRLQAKDGKILDQTFVDQELSLASPDE